MKPPPPPEPAAGLRPVAVLNLVGLCGEVLREHMPRLAAWSAPAARSRIQPILPSLTCSVQATYLTGVLPETHGIVANGWYFRDTDEIKFWRQSNALIQAPKLWETLRRRHPGFTCANLFWWFAMNAEVDQFVTPRPIYRADGLKLPDVLTRPAELRDQLTASLGTFPLFEFWGPRTSIRSSQWIADAARLVVEQHNPTLTLVYLPHLDYNLQRLGPQHPGVIRDLREIDTVAGDLIDFLEARGREVLVLSEYGIEPVSRPVHLNRALREAGFITVRNECGGEILLPSESRAFAVADHQIAHIYVRNPADLPAVDALLSQLPGVEQLLKGPEIQAAGLAHPRSGERIAIAKPGCWFTYYYWLDDARAPDFAPIVDIHNKPGYDPAELHLNPALRYPALRAARRLLQKKLGFRTTFDLIPLQGECVGGSHGRLLPEPERHPLLLRRSGSPPLPDTLAATEICGLIASAVSGNRKAGDTI